MSSILLGAPNIEQSKLLDLDGLGHLIDRTQKSLHPQRQALAELVGGDDLSDFNYAPHTKQYTGEMKILKGWCGSRHFTDKALHMDFVHSADGHPLFVSYDDDYADLRERYFSEVWCPETAND